MRQPRMTVKGLLIVGALFLAAGRAQASTISITFDQPQLVNNTDPLLQFYNGGLTYLGAGPGPNLGVEFTLNARVITNTSGLVGTFTTPGIMELYSDAAREGEPISATMDVLGGFAGTVYFDYAAIDSAGTLAVYSGLDGTGTLLGNLNLPVTSPITGPGTFIADSVNFSGVAKSVVFDGGNKQLAIDDITLASAPEPSALCLLAIGALWCLGAGWRQQRGRV